MPSCLHNAEIKNTDMLFSQLLTHSVHVDLFPSCLGSLFTFGVFILHNIDTRSLSTHFHLVFKIQGMLQLWLFIYFSKYEM